MKPNPHWFSAADDSIKDAKKKLEKEVLGSPYITDLEKDAIENDKNALLPWMKAVEIVEAQKTSNTTARILYRFPVQHSYLNPGQSLHGGISAGIYDVATTWLLHLVRKKGFWWGFGTTRTLNVTFIRPAPEGEMLLMDTELVHTGKRLCFMRATLMRERDRAIISTCEHQKYNDDADSAFAKL